MRLRVLFVSLGHDFEIVKHGENMSRTRVVVIGTFFVYFTFQTCEIVMEKGI